MSSHRKRFVLRDDGETGRGDPAPLVLVDACVPGWLNEGVRCASGGSETRP
jgi:hypothetical protein